MINKSDSRFAVVRFCNHSYDYRPNRTPLSPLTSIDLMLSVGYFVVLALAVHVTAVCDDDNFPVSDYVHMIYNRIIITCFYRSCWV